jgi:spermidine synthase
VFSFPWWLSFTIGFLSLSVEILWVRVMGFTYETLPPAFSFVLFCYLVGIALGAVLGKRLCGRSKDLYAAATIVLSVSALTDVFTPWVIGNFISPNDLHLMAPALAIAFTAALKSTLFPIVHHLGSTAEGPHIGRSVSRIYFGNIVGATLGPLVTGFVALDYLSVDQCFGVVGAVGLLAATACALKDRKPKLILATLVTAITASAIAQTIILPGPGSLRALAAGRAETMTHFISNRHGIIHTVRRDRGDIVYGGNVYDGMTSVNVDANPNSLERVYVLALLHPDPKRVLFVGMSAGAWVRAMEGFPSVESIDTVEINPGYVELTRDYPSLAPVLKDPRMHLHFDDGRRWLRRNPAAQFDIIVQNTTYHWRANVDNLLSREYFSELKRHLNPGGIAIANTTGSFDVLATVQAVFAYAYRFRNFVYASDHPLVPDPNGLGSIHRPNGAAFATENAPPTSVVALLQSARLEPVNAFLERRGVQGEIITDDNLLTEYRHGRRFGPMLLRVLLPPSVEGFELTDP